MKNYITPEGAAQLKEELRKLLHEERPSLVKTVAWAASNGDRSENGDYIYGKRRLREIDRRIRALTQKLESAEIIHPHDPHNTKRVLFGAWVTLLTEEGTQKKYKIVGQDEIDPQRGHISWVSPVGKALLNAQVGDVVTVQTPKGAEDFEILKIEY